MAHNVPNPDALHGADEQRAAIPDGVWVKCVACRDILFARELVRAGQVCPGCEHHGTIRGQERAEYIVDAGSFQPLMGLDPVVAGTSVIDDMAATIGIADARTVEEHPPSELLDGLAHVARVAGVNGLPLVLFAAGGAGHASGDSTAAERCAVHAAIRRIADRGLPFILVLTDPVADVGYAVSLPAADVTIAEASTHDHPSATIGEPLESPTPFVDLFVSRREIAQELGKLLAFFGQPGTGDDGPSD